VQVQNAKTATCKSLPSAAGFGWLAVTGSVTAFLLCTAVNQAGMCTLGCMCSVERTAEGAAALAVGSGRLAVCCRTTHPAAHAETMNILSSCWRRTARVSSPWHRASCNSSGLSSQGRPPAELCCLCSAYRETSHGLNGTPAQQSLLK